MSNAGPTNPQPVKFMRWTARVLSIPWALWALFWTFFVLAHFLPPAVLAIIMSIAALIFVGSAIVASVWGMEALGGRVLLLDGVLIIALGVFLPHSPILVGSFQSTALAFFTLALPPLVAGSLFLVCHRISRTSGEQQEAASRQY